jgi:tagatose-1,6-bisphosphate aldolase
VALAVDGGNAYGVWDDEALRRRHQMAAQTVQQVVEYLKANPEVAQKAKDYIKAHPDDVKSALKEVAEARGWDLSMIDASALKAEISKITH